MPGLPSRRRLDRAPRASDGEGVLITAQCEVRWIPIGSITPPVVEVRTGRNLDAHVAGTERRDELHVAELGRRDQLHTDEMVLLATALESRDTIGQAKGVIMVTMHCNADEAFRLLKEQSQHENRKLVEIAQRAQRRPHHID